MANTNTRKSGPGKGSNPSGRPVSVSKEISTAQKTVVPKDIDSSQYIIVRNGFQGQLVYKSQRTGEVFQWSEFGDEQEIELRELRNVRNSNKSFFINNWFMFNDEDDWVIDYLGVRQFYKNAISIDSFDSIFEKKPTELKKLLNELSEGQKKSVAYRASQLIAEKKIDSLSVISALEDTLGIELIEK